MDRAQSIAVAVLTLGSSSGAELDALGGATNNVTGQLAALEPSVAPVHRHQGSATSTTAGAGGQRCPKSSRSSSSNEISDGLVDVEGDANTIVIRIKGSGDVCFGVQRVAEDKFVSPVEPGGRSAQR